MDWHEWGDDALALAKKENKPLLISIGYASCHWCHEMEKESFMDTAVARIMNENFICINVDREERPDVDHLYMNACKLISGGDGGWPLNAFALPNGKPFFAGTYYSKASWKNLLTEISKAYKEKHALVTMQAEALTRGIAEETLSFNTPNETIPFFTRSSYVKLFDSLYVELDTVNGGLKGETKFPMPSVMEFLLQYYYQTGDIRALNAACLTLTKMALGGIYDQVGGGFARYATDHSWRVPHFEKMLYDNAQLISLYAHAYQITGNDFYKTVLNETISFIETELPSPSGGYYSSLNADTENGEGDFYTWNEKEFESIAKTKLVAEYFNVTTTGSWKNGKNILAASYTPGAFATLNRLSPVQFNSLLGDVKSKLLNERNKRKKPTKDTKIVTSWNAMMLKAYTDAYVATGEQRCLIKAVALATFFEQTLLTKDGTLMRIFSDGKTSVDGFLDDYAWTSYAFMKLYQVTFEKHWLDLSKQLANFARSNFYNNGSRLFNYCSNHDAKLVATNIETADEGTPSSNSIMATVVYSLGIIYDDADLTALSRNMLQSVSDNINKYPLYHATWCCVGGLLTSATYEVAVMGKDAIAKNKELQKNYLPDCIIMGAEHEEDLPLLEGKLRDSSTLIYVCTNKVCKKPVEDTEEALKQIVHHP